MRGIKTTPPFDNVVRLHLQIILRVLLSIALTFAPSYHNREIYCDRNQLRHLCRCSSLRFKSRPDSDGVSRDVTPRLFRQMHTAVDLTCAPVAIWCQLLAGLEGLESQLQATHATSAIIGDRA